MRLKLFTVTTLILPVFITAQSWNCELIGQLDYSQTANDIWGYVASDGTEYALVGTSSGTSIVDVSTDESNPTEVAFIPGQNSTWRDVKTYGHYMYVGTEASQGVQVVDIEDPENAELVYTWNGVTNSHNIFQADGYLYVVGASGADMHILDLSNPAQPVEVGGWDGEYLHDVYVRGDYAYGCGIYSSTMFIIDISDKTNPSTVTSWSYSGAAHACWLSEDGNYLITSDETSGGHIRIWDVSDFGNINMVSEWMADGGQEESVHNVFVRDNYLYASHYVFGLQILDISDPYNPVLAGYYDTYPGSGGLYEGAWGAYPFTESCYTYISDMSGGLFVVHFAGCAGADDDDPRPPDNFTAYSDYTLPESVNLTWDDPTELHGGGSIGNFSIDIYRDGTFAASVGEGVEYYSDNGLVDGQFYEYEAQTRLLSNDSLSVFVDDGAFCGGSPTPSPPSDFDVSNNDNSVTLNWISPTTQEDGTPLDDLANIVIYRNGEQVASTSSSPGEQGWYNDSPPQDYTYSYYLTAVDNESPPNESSPTPSLDIWVGESPAIFIWEPPDNSPGSGAALLESAQNLNQSVFLADNLQQFGDPVAADYEAIFVLLGISSSTHVLVEGEATLLIEYLEAGGNIYMEGGETWAWDSPTSLHNFFHINGTDDGSGDLGTIIGEDGTFAENLYFTYQGENNWIDHLEPGSGAVTILSNSSPSYGVGVAYEAENYRTIGTSFEFGGLSDGAGGTKDDLLTVMLDFFGIDVSAGGNIGDVNGDGILDIYDVMKVVNFMLGIAEPTEEEAWAADMNSDTMIDVFDIVLLVDAILNGAEGEAPVKDSTDLLFR